VEREREREREREKERERNIDSLSPFSLDLISIHIPAATPPAMRVARRDWLGSEEEPASSSPRGAVADGDASYSKLLGIWVVAGELSFIALGVRSGPRKWLGAVNLHADARGNRGRGGDASPCILLWDQIS
jgi:hypothetical protein